MSPMARRVSVSDLPSEILVHIATYLPAEDRHHLRLACKLLRDAADSPAVWRHLELILSQHVLRKIAAHKWFSRTLSGRRVQRANMGSVGGEKQTTLEKAFRCLSNLQHLTLQGSTVPMFLSVANQTENGLLDKLDWITLQFANVNHPNDEKIIQNFLDTFPNASRLSKLSLYHVHLANSLLFAQPGPGYLSASFIGSLCQWKSLTSLALGVDLPFQNGAAHFAGHGAGHGAAANGHVTAGSASCNHVLLYLLEHLPRLERLWLLTQPLVLDLDYLPDEAKHISDCLSNLKLHTLKVDIGASSPPKSSPWMRLFNRLEALSVRFGWTVTDPSGVLAELSPHLHKLTILNILCVGRPGEQCPFDFSVIPCGVETLRLSFSAGSCLRRSPHGVLHSLPTNTCSHVQHLHLLQAKLMQVDFDRIATHFTSLKTLHCSLHNDSNPEGLMVLQRCKTLTRLCLYYAVQQKVDFVVKCLRQETGNRIVTTYIVNYDEPVFKL